MTTITKAKEKWDGRKFEDPQRRETEDTDTGGGDPFADYGTPEPDYGIPDVDGTPDPEPSKEKPSSPSVWVTGDQLLAMKFADPVWLLPDILPESGAFIISGKPKAGKSWFVLQLAMSVVQGGSFLNRDVPDGAVLYFALEDNWRRLQDRMMKLQPDADRHRADFAGLAYRVVAPTVDAGLANELSRVIAGSQKKIRLVILDTLQKVRGNGVAAGSQYALDYDVLGKLKRVADKHGICLVIVHHLRKADSDDIHDGVSGTNGIAGAVDGSLVLVRQRGSDAAVLHITGRDMPENELGLKFDGTSWTFAGSASEVKASGEQNEVFNALKPYGGEGATIKQVCDDLEKKRRTVTYHIGKLVDAGRVRVRNTKPAPHYAVCDGDASTSSNSTTKCSTDNAGTRVTECRPDAKHRQKWATCGNDHVEWVCLSCDARGTFSKAAYNSLHPVDPDADPMPGSRPDPVYDVATTSTHNNNTSVCEKGTEDENSVATLATLARVATLATLATPENDESAGKGGNDVAMGGNLESVENSSGGNAGKGGNMGDVATPENWIDF